MTIDRRAKISAMLADDPDNDFLHYTLAMEELKGEGAEAEAGLDRLRTLIERSPEYVPAYFYLGQRLGEREQWDEARSRLTVGIEVARRVGDEHAAMEMSEFLATLPAE